MSLPFRLIGPHKTLDAKYIYQWNKSYHLRSSGLLTE
jgi:hypothetical protein